MKDFLVLVVVAVLGFLGYQLLYKDKSMHQVINEIEEKTSESQAYLAKEYLDYKIPKLKGYRNGEFSYSDIKCFDDSEYGVTCTVKKISFKDEDVKFDLTLFGADDILKHKVGLFDLNTANIGIKVSNFVGVDFPNDEKVKKLEQYLDDISGSIYLTSSKYSGKNKLSFRVQGSNNLFFSSDLTVSKDSKSEKLITILSNCLLDGDCEGEFSSRKDFESLMSHMYFEELNSEIKIPSDFMDTMLDDNDKKMLVFTFERDKDIPLIYKRKIKKIIEGKTTYSEDSISAKREVSFMNIINALDDNNENFFKNKFNYEVDGESYNPWE